MSVGFFGYDAFARRPDSGFSPIFITAALSVAVLLVVAAWELRDAVQEKNAALHATGRIGLSGAPLRDTAFPFTAGEGATSTDPLTSIGPAVMAHIESAYEQLQQAGVYSTSTAELVGQNLAPYVAAGVQYNAFTATDLKTDSDTSYARMLRYRDDLRTSLAPLLKNTQPEYEIFAYYVDTRDASYLRKLQGVAEDYRAAAAATAKVVVPKDAVSYHVAILNAMEQFAATLDALASHADDPFASVALLRGYNRAESDMLYSFNSLTTYYKTKRP